MTKKIAAIVSVCAVVALLALVGCGSSQPAKSTNTSSNTQATTTQQAPAQNNAQSSSSNYIGEEKAKEIALSHAGLSASAVSELKAELDTDDGRIHYDVEFKQGNTEYDYDIDASTGEIIKYDSEIDDD